MAFRHDQLRRLRDVFGVSVGIHVLNPRRWRGSFERRSVSFAELRRQRELLADFDPDFYRTAYGDLACLSESELRGHWLGGGAHEARIASKSQLAREYPAIDWATFDARAFLEANPDIPEMSDASATIYYARYGQREGRPRFVTQLPPGTVEGLARQILPSQEVAMPVTSWRDLIRAVDDAVDTGFSGEIEEILAIADLRLMVVRLVEAIHHRQPSPYEVDLWSSMAERRGRPFIVSSVVRFFARDQESVRLRSGIEWSSGIEDLADGFRLLGDSKTVVQVSDWRRRRSAAALAPVAPRVLEDVLPRCAVGRLPRVSVICSLYAGSEYIRPYLENLTSQVGFERHELVIVDAASPEGEATVIREYQERFSNIVYHRTDTRIGIYEAWNVGIGLSTGEFLTNANLDDSRHTRSLDDMAAFLDAHPEIDVVYTDSFYALEPHVEWRVLEAVGIRTDLPPISTWTILDYNSPHCAPMWRRALHEDLGTFDEAFRSAGDWEFWVRCAEAGRTFHKLDEPRIGYYLNPRGISTSRDSWGIREQWPIRERYRNLLLEPERPLEPLRTADTIHA